MTNRILVPIDGGTATSRIKVGLGKRGRQELAAQTILLQDRADSDALNAAKRKMMISLSPELREIAFFCFARFSVEEIAERLELEFGTVLARMSCLRKRLKIQFELAGTGTVETDQILTLISRSTKWPNDFTTIEMKPWVGGTRFNWREFVRYIDSRKSIVPEIADALKRARRQAERIEHDAADLDYIVDQIGALAVEIQRTSPNEAILRKYTSRIQKISPIVARILEPICGSHPQYG